MEGGTINLKPVYELGYRYFRMPYERGPDEEFVGLVESGRVAPCRAIDLGCGTGANAIFLAQRGFDVTGVDFAPTAIKRAQRKAQAAGVQIHFVVDDLTDLRHVAGRFGFLVDYGAFHSLGLRGRDRYHESVLQLTEPGSQLLLWCFEWPQRWWERLIPFYPGPPRPGDIERRFQDDFMVERIAGTAAYWLSGFAAYLLTRMAPSCRDI